jgi:hypothetical protein
MRAHTRSSRIDKNKRRQRVGIGGVRKDKESERERLRGKKWEKRGLVSALVGILERSGPGLIMLFFAAAAVYS